MNYGIVKFGKKAKVMNGYNRIILYNTWRGREEYTAWSCSIKCDNCPLKFRCYTTTKILCMHEFTIERVFPKWRDMCRTGTRISKEYAERFGEQIGEKL